MFPLAGRVEKTDAEIKRDKLIIASLNKMETLRVSGGGIYVDAKDLKVQLNRLRERTKHLVVR